MEERNQKKPSPKANRQGQRTELSKRLTVSGHLMAGFLVLAFAAIFTNSIIQLDFWQNHFFRGTLNAGNSCQVSTAFQEDPSLAPIQNMQNLPVVLPHKSQSLIKLTEGNTTAAYLRADYRCQVDTSSFKDQSETIYLHTGWIKSENTLININGTERASFNGMDKPAIPLTKVDIESGLNIEIKIAARNRGKPGLAYPSPFVISAGTSENFRVLGVDYALATQKSLYDVLPLLTLGVILAFGWLIGIRSTSLIVTFLYFCFSAMHSMLWIFNDYWPWKFNITRDISNLLIIGSLFAFLIFALEIFGFFRRRVFHMTAALAGIVLVGSIGISIFEPPYSVIDTSRTVLRVILSICMSGLIYYGGRRIQNMRRTSAAELAEKRILKIVVGLLAFAIVAIGWDGLGKNIGIAFRLSPQMFKLLPLFVGGVVLYSLYLIEQQLQEEKGRRAKMEGELNLAAKLQNVLLPEKKTGELLGFQYKVDSKPFSILGGDWIKIHVGDEKALMVLGDVVGKGASAALTHSGIAASWESHVKLWDKGQIDLSELLQQINTTMYDLFRGDMNTTFAAVEIHKNGKVKLTSGGNYWLHLNQTKSKPIASRTRSPLGVNAELKVELQEIDLAKGDWLVCFTDGVIEGNRPISRFLRNVQPDLDGLTADSLQSALVEAGAGEVHPDDASILILNFLDSLGKETAA